MGVHTCYGCGLVGPQVEAVRGAWLESVGWRWGPEESGMTPGPAGWGPPGGRVQGGERRLREAQLGREGGARGAWVRQDRKPRSEEGPEG